jgi:transposase
MTTTQTVLRGKNTAIQGALYISFELGDKKWKLTTGDGRHSASRYTVDAPATRPRLLTACARPRSAASSEHK